VAPPLYSVRILEGTASPELSYTYTVDDGQTVNIRDLEGLFLTGPLSGGLVTFAVDGLTWGTWAAPTNAFFPLSWQGRCVLPGSSELTVEVIGEGASCEFVLSGYLFTN